mmetsp:Transcript_41562/g.134259  ORF Transcript_41562/g.134259 Transcript_41562/m.134259 type:complete len:1307 (-) Transcript_41562:26-3946(-)
MTAPCTTLLRSAAPDSRWGTPGLDEDLVNAHVWRRGDGVDHGVGDVLGVEPVLTLLRRLRELRPRSLVRVLGQVGELRSAIAGLDRRDSQAPVRVLLAQALAEGLREELRATVHREPREGLPPGVRGGHDDVPRAPGEHPGQHRGRGVQQALDVDVDFLVPLLLLQVLKARVVHHARIVHEDVDGPQGRLARLHEVFHLLAIRHINLARMVDGPAASSGIHVLADRLEVLEAASPNTHVRSGLAQGAGDRGTDAGGGSGDHGDLAEERAPQRLRGGLHDAGDLPCLDVLVHAVHGDLRQDGAEGPTFGVKVRVDAGGELLHVRLARSRATLEAVPELLEAGAGALEHRPAPLHQRARLQAVAFAPQGLEVLFGAEALCEVRDVERLATTGRIRHNLHDALRCNIHGRHLHGPALNHGCRTNLDATSQHQEVEVRGIPDGAARLAAHVAGPEDHGGQAAVRGAAHKLLGDPLALGVAVGQLGRKGADVNVFGAILHAVGEDAICRDVGHPLDLAGQGELKHVPGPNDVGGAQALVGVDEVHHSGAVHHDVHARADGRVDIVLQAQVVQGDVANQHLGPRLGVLRPQAPRVHRLLQAELAIGRRGRSHDAIDDVDVVVLQQLRQQETAEVPCGTCQHVGARTHLREVRGPPECPHRDVVDALRGVVELNLCVKVHFFMCRAVAAFQELRHFLDGGVREEVDDADFHAQIRRHALHQLRGQQGVPADVEEGIVLDVDLLHLHDAAPDGVELDLHLRLWERAVVHDHGGARATWDGARGQVDPRQTVLVQLARHLVGRKRRQIHQIRRHHVVWQLLLEGKSDLEHRGLLVAEHHIGNHELVLSLLALHSDDARGHEVGERHDDPLDGAQLHGVAAHLLHGVAAPQDLELVRGQDAGAVAGLIHPLAVVGGEALRSQLVEVHIAPGQRDAGDVQLALLAQGPLVEVGVEDVGLRALDELAHGAKLASAVDATLEIHARDIVALADAVEVQDLGPRHDFLDPLLQGYGHDLSAKRDHLHGLIAIGKRLLVDGLGVEHCFHQARGVEHAGHVHLLNELAERRRVVDDVVWNNAEDLTSQEWTQHLPHEEDVASLDLLLVRRVRVRLVAPLVGEDGSAVWASDPLRLAGGAGRVDDVRQGVQVRLVDSRQCLLVYAGELVEARAPDGVQDDPRLGLGQPAHQVALADHDRGLAVLQHVDQHAVGVCSVERQVATTGLQDGHVRQGVLVAPLHEDGHTDIPLHTLFDQHGSQLVAELVEFLVSDRAAFADQRRQLRRLRGLLPEHAVQALAELGVRGRPEGLHPGKEAPSNVSTP